MINQQKKWIGWDTCYKPWPELLKCIATEGEKSNPAPQSTFLWASVLNECVCLTDVGVGAVSEQSCSDTCLCLLSQFDTAVKEFHSALLEEQYVAAAEQLEQVP